MSHITANVLYCLFTDPITGEVKKEAKVFDFVDYTKMFRRHARIRDKMYHQEPLWDIKNIPEGLLDALPEKLNNKS